MYTFLWQGLGVLIGIAGCGALAVGFVILTGIIAVEIKGGRVK